MLFPCSQPRRRPSFASFAKKLFIQSARNRNFFRWPFKRFTSGKGTQNAILLEEFEFFSSRSRSFVQIGSCSWFLFRPFWAFPVVLLDYIVASSDGWSTVSSGKRERKTNSWYRRKAHVNTEHSFPPWENWIFSSICQRVAERVVQVGRKCATQKRENPFRTCY